MNTRVPSDHSTDRRLRSPRRFRSARAAALLASSCMTVTPALAAAPTCAPAPSHALATDLATIKVGDYWVYSLTGTITPPPGAPPPGAPPGGPPGGAAPSGPIPIGGTFVEYAETLMFNGKPTLALAVTQDIQVDGASIYGTHPVPVGIFYVEQDPVTKIVYLIGDNMGPNGTVRTSKQRAEFYPGTWSKSTTYNDNLDFTDGEKTSLYLHVTGTTTVKTPVGNFQAWVAPNGAGGGLSDSGTAYWSPQVGAPVAFETMATLPNGQINHVIATLTKASTVPSLYPVLADGLNQPRGLAFDLLGDLWFTEAGVGGTDVCIPFMGQENCFGNTSKVSALAFGQRFTVTSTLASLSTPQADQSDGANGITFADGLPYVVIGNGGPQSATSLLGSRSSQTGVVLAPGFFDRKLSLNTVASLANFEYMNFPHIPDPAGKPEAQSNPFGITSIGQNVYVADGAGQTVTEVTPRGAVSLFGIMPNQEVSVPSTMGGASKMIHENSVPTGIMPAPDGRGLLAADYSGFPYISGSSRIFRFQKERTPTVFASGFNNIIGISPAPDGGLYALEMYTNGSLSGDQSGSVLHVNALGKQDKVIACQGLIAPTGITTGKDGSVYVSNYGLVSGQGQVVKISTRK
jgi:hypothetical protein